MSTNNFQKLMDEEMKNAPPLPPHIKTNVQGSMSFFQFVGKTIELYLPRAIDTALLALSGDTVEEIPQGSAPKDPASDM